MNILKNTTKPSLVLMIMLVFLLSGRQANSRTTKEKRGDATINGKVVHVRQQNFGNWTCLLGDKKACVKTGITTAYHLPPYKKVYITSPENKAYMIWETDKPYNLGSVNKQFCPPCAKLVKIGSKKILGYNCTQVDGYSRRGEHIVKFYFTKELNAPFSWYKGVAFSGNYPASYGLPMKVEMKQRANRGYFWFTPFKVEKIENRKFKANTFKMPAGYKKVNSIAALVFSSNGKFDESNIEDLFEHHFDKRKRKE